MIRFEDVTLRLGDRTVLDGISLDLPEPRVGLIGANGSGKSSLARLVNGLLQPTSGRVEVDGLDPGRQGRQVRQRVGFLFSDPDAQIVMPTVAEDVAFSLRRRRLAKADVARQVSRTLDRFGLADWADVPAHALSSGQKQLLALASVLVTEPAVLVADEPTTLLDLRNALRISRLLRTLPQQVLLVTHDLDLVADWGRVICLDAGRVLFDGPGREVTARYRAMMIDRETSEEPS